MCGFLGSSFKENEQEFVELLKLGKLRGPDSTGIWENDNIRLGFNRLAIQDLSVNGNQPMCSFSKTWVIVFNGEIYNHLEIRQKIVDYEFQGNSDTETILASLEKFGFKKTIKSLNGMFAIAAYHLVENRVYLARDFAGIKPLYYGVKDGCIIFASQFNQLFRHSAFKNVLKLRPEIVKEYMGFGYMPAPNTIYQNIFQLNIGEILIFDIKQKEVLSKVSFFNWETSSAIQEMDNKTTETFLSCFNDVIKEQLQADVPLASFMSSGIDSPLVTGIARKYKPDIEAFTIAVDDVSVNEAELAKQYADYLGVKQVIEPINQQDLIGEVNNHFRIMPEPMGDYSSLPTYLITKKAKKLATVMLSGDGGDELFWGYPRFMSQARKAWLFNFPLWLRKPTIRVFRKLGVKNLSYALDSAEHFEDWTRNFQLQLFNEHLDEMIPNTNFSEETKQLYTFKGSIRKYTDVLKWLKWNEFYGHMQRVLRKVDLTSMGNSLEVRVPFLDKRVIELSNKIRPDLGRKHQEPKLILKKALAYYIPTNIIMKEKKGFSVPMADYLRNELRHDLSHFCLEVPIYGDTIINSNFVRKYVNEFLNNKHGNAWGVWHIYAWQKWAYIHILN